MQELTASKALESRFELVEELSVAAHRRCGRWGKSEEGLLFSIFLLPYRTAACC